MKGWIGHVRGIAVALGIGALAACTGPTGGFGTPPQPQPSTAPLVGQVDGDIRVVAALPEPDTSATGGVTPIMREDVLTIDVYRADELDREVQVDGRGRIALPLIGEVVAAGRSPRQLERDLAARYGRDYIVSPQISVFVKSSVAARATVEGEVKRAGIFPVTATSTLLGMVAQAGGFTTVADPAKVYVFRKVGDVRMVANYDLTAIRAGRQRNPPIVAGDVVVAFSSSTRIAMRNLREALGLARGAVGIIP